MEVQSRPRVTGGWCMTKSTFMRLDGESLSACCWPSARVAGPAATTPAERVARDNRNSRHHPAAGASGDAGTSGGAGTPEQPGRSEPLARRHGRRCGAGRGGTTGTPAAAAPPETPAAAAPPTRARREQRRHHGTAGNGGTGGAAMPSAGCGTTPTTTAETTFMIDVSGTSRSYIVTLPANYNASQPHQLVFALARPHRHRDADRARQLLRPQVAHDQRDLRRAPGSRHHQLIRPTPAGRTPTARTSRSCARRWRG